MKIVLILLLLVSLIGCTTSHTVNQTVNRPVISEPTPWSVICRSQEFKQLDPIQQKVFMDNWLSQWYNYYYGNRLSDQSDQSEVCIKYEIRNEMEEMNEEVRRSVKPKLINDLGLFKDKSSIDNPITATDTVPMNPIIEDQIRDIIKETHKGCNY